MNSLKGVGVALVTPFHEDFSIDFDALERVIEYNIRGKVDYFVTLGTTGESAALSSEEQQEILAFTLRVVNGRLPVVVGIGGNNTPDVLHKLKTWQLDGVAAVLSVSPYYSKPSQEGIYQHYAAIAKASPKPVLLYNVPGRTVSNISVETTLRLATDFAGKIIGTKEASSNMVQCMHLYKALPKDFLLISGDDHATFPLIACGFVGVISVVANAFPADFAQLVHMSLAGNYVEAREFQSAIIDRLDMLFIENNPAGVKAFLSEQGFIKNVLRLPLVPLSNNHMVALKKLL